MKRRGAGRQGSRAGCRSRAGSHRTRQRQCPSLPFPGSPVGTRPPHLSAPPATFQNRRPGADRKQNAFTLCSSKLSSLRRWGGNKIPSAVKRHISAPLQLVYDVFGFATQTGHLFLSHSDLTNSADRTSKGRTDEMIRRAFVTHLIRDRQDRGTARTDVHISDAHPLMRRKFLSAFTATILTIGFVCTTAPGARGRMA